MASSTREVTQLLHNWSNGDEAALSRLGALVEAESHHLAEAYMRREPADARLAARMEPGSRLALQRVEKIR